MAISNASRLSDFGSGIGSEGAVIQVDNSNKRLGVGTDTPLAMLQVGSGVSVYGDSGIVSATTYYGSGASLTGIAATDHVSTFDLVVAGIATFHNDVRVTAGGLDVVGVVTSNNKVVATGLDIGTAGVDIDGQTDLDELVVAGVATFSNTVDVNASVDATDVSAIGGNFTGILTATSFAGNGANLTGVGGEVDITSVLFL